MHDKTVSLRRPISIKSKEIIFLLLSPRSHHLEGLSPGCDIGLY